MRSISMRARRRWLTTAAALVVTGLVVASCSSSNTPSGGGGNANVAVTKKPVTLRVDLFGDFGYHDLYKQFQAKYPNITIKEDVEQYADHHNNFAKHVAAGSGADDVVAVEVGYIAQFKAQPQNFYDLRQYGADKLKSQWLPWKWDQSLATNGAQIGFGTDVGSLAICYRRDLFEKAGLPADRDQVSALWPDWASFVSVGEQFQQKAPAGTYFFDSGSNVYNAMIGQVNPAYYDQGGSVVASSNASVKQAWDLTMQAVQKKQSAGYAAFSDEWNTGFKKGTFATVTCPAWMMGYIQGQAPDTTGKWDVAAVPGSGGNWGGSFLTIPRQSKHPREAYELIKFLTSPEAESFIFKQTGNLPSQPALYADAAISTFNNPFFNDAPVGQIFTTSAKRLQPQILGPKQGDIQTAASNAIQRVEQGKQTPDQSWQQFLKDVENLTA
jgi:cellobiose transport system substrate-binding protein